MEKEAMRFYRERATAFYRETFGLEPERREGATVFPVGDQELRLVEPGPVPRGGLHVHFAMATPPQRYDGWVDRLAPEHDLVEHEFGSSRSLYVFDPDGHCVEIGSVGDAGSAADLTGIFEVEDLERAESFYTALGFSVVDRGRERPRIRLSGPVDLELWEPQRGLADARGGVHVDLGFAGQANGALPTVVEREARSISHSEGRVRVRDPDGHSLTIRES